TGQDEGIDAFEVLRSTDLHGVDAAGREGPDVTRERALERQDADRGDRYQPRSSNRVPSVAAPVGSMPMPVIGVPTPRDPFARMSASRKWVVASTMALARGAGSSDLKMPEPTNTASAPSCMARAASAGVARPPAQKSGTGRVPVSAISWTSGSGARSCLAHSNSSGSSAWVSLRMSPRSEERRGGKEETET